jgi:hypothetical protein
MDILGMMVRQDRVKAILKKKEPEWLKEETDKANGVGQPITFGSKDEADLEWLLEMIETDDEDDDEDDEDDEDEEEGEEKKDEKEDELPTLPADFVWKKPTPEEIVKQRLEEYSRKLYNMDEHLFTTMCVKEGILSENEVFHTICIPHD